MSGVGGPTKLPPWPHLLLAAHHCASRALAWAAAANGDVQILLILITGILPSLLPVLQQPGLVEDGHVVHHLGLAAHDVADPAGGEPLVLPGPQEVFPVSLADMVHHLILRQSEIKWNNQYQMAFT